jgi:hypothetical protein
MTDNINLDVFVAEATTQGENQGENHGTGPEAINRQRGPGFTSPEDMALAKAFCAASEQERVGTSQTSADFKKAIGGCYNKFIFDQAQKDQQDYSRLSATSQAASPLVIYPLVYPSMLPSRQSLKRSLAGTKRTFLLHAT